MLAAASHALRGYNDDLAARALKQSKRLFKEANELMAKNPRPQGRGGMGGGPRPNGEAQPPEEAPDQERPQPGKDGMAVDPSGKDHPEDGVRPQRPEGFGGMPGTMQADGERVTVFTIAEGGNFITQVAPAEAEN